MKTTIFLITASIISLSFFSCGNNKKNKDLNLDSIINSTSKDPNSKGENKCLLDFQSKYDALLSEEDILTATGFSKNKMETKYNKVLKNPENHEFVFQFNNGRIGKLLGIKKEMEVPDLIAIRSIKPMSLTTFKQSYQAATDEQIQAANDAVNDMAKGNTGNSDIDKTVNNQNVHKDQVKKTGGELTGTLNDISKGNKQVDGLGDAAVWNEVTYELYVLQNGVKFDIRVDISNDKEKNKSVAIQLAQIILNKCK